MVRYPSAHRAEECSDFLLCMIPNKYLLFFITGSCGPPLIHNIQEIPKALGPTRLRARLVYKPKREATKKDPVSSEVDDKD